MILFVFSLFFCLCMANQLNFEISVIEKDARYIQKVQTNLYTNHVYYSTPAHNDIAESHKIQDFNKGMQITCIPSIQECHLMTIETTNYLNAGNVTESIVHMWNKGVNTIVDKNSTRIEHHVTLIGSEIMNTAFLGQEMRAMLQKFGYPLYRTTPIPDGVVIENYHLKGNHTLTGRSLDPHLVAASVRFQCNKQPEPVWGYTTAHCEHVFECQSEQSCRAVHAYSKVMYKCFCCPGFFTLNDPSRCMCQKFTK